MKPILFNTPMVRAILDGRKTHTRRVCKITVNGNQPVDHRRCESLVYPERNHEGICANFYGGSGLYKGASKPQYQPGDILYVRETWAEWTGGYVYKADGSASPYPLNFVDRWHPSIHMSREAARLFLRVTDVWAERLQKIDEYGAKAEGAEMVQVSRTLYSYRKGFGKLWNSTIKPVDRDRYGWAANPWVWTYEFERCEKPEV